MIKAYLSPDFMKNALTLFFLLFVFGLQSQYVFQINDFRAFDNDLSMLGNAAFKGEALRVSPASANVTGAAWYKQRKIDLKNGFETEFSFLISGQDDQGGGDGFAFVIQDQGTEVIGGLGDDIGYKQIPYGLAIEFDTRNDQEGSKNHINLSFYEPSTGKYRRYATVHEIPEIQDGVPHITKINYLDGNLQVYLDSYLFPVLSVKIDIAAKVQSSDGKAWLGFTSATSDNFANHDLLTWSLKEELAPPDGVKIDSITVQEGEVLVVTDRKLKLKVWDHNKIDGDIISLKFGDQWILTDYKLEAKPLEIEVTLHGFSQSLILYANNTGLIPPNTASISIWDGSRYKNFELEADLRTSEAVTIQYRAPETGETN